MKKLLIFLALTLFLLIIPKSSFAYGSFVTTRVNDFQLESDMQGYFPTSTHNYAPGETLNVSFEMRNDTSIERTAYGFMGLAKLGSNCGIYSFESGASEGQLIADTSNRNCQEIKAVSNNHTGANTFVLPAGAEAGNGDPGPTKTITLSITLPSDIPDGYYQYDIGFGPLCEPNGSDWEDKSKFDDYGCNTSNGSLIGAGFIRVVNNDTYTIPSTAPSSQPTPSPSITPGSPSIQGIRITNGGGGGKAVRTSGSRSDQSGGGYNNPMTITLNAVAAKNADGITDVPSTFYMAFYKQSTGLITSDSTIINSATSKLADPTNGVLLAYDQPNNRCGGSHCVFDPTKSNPNDQWVNIAIFGSNGYSVNDSSGQPLYKVVSGVDGDTNAANKWRVTFDKNFGSKSMYTSAYVFDLNGKSAFIGGDIPPSTQ